MEPAFRRIYGVGHLSWEWSEETALRSHLHPALFTLILAPLHWLGVDVAASALVRWAPYFLHAAFFAIGDSYARCLMSRLFSEKHGKRRASEKMRRQTFGFTRLQFRASLSSCTSRIGSFGIARHEHLRIRSRPCLRSSASTIIRSRRRAPNCCR